MKKYLFILIASLLFSGSIFAQEPAHHWAYDDTPYANNMAVACWVTLDGVYLDNTNIEVAAFVGDEVRMSAFLESLNPAFAHMFIFQSIGLNTNGETITFKMYDHNNSKEYDFCTFTVIGEIDGTVGTVDNPTVLPFFTTFSKPITAYTPNTQDHYYLIASPLNEAVSPNEVTNMKSNSYDLYYFDQGQEKEWINYKGNNGNFDLEPGKGYLYANSQTIDLIFAGAPYNGDGTVTLDKDLKGTNSITCGFEGWNLVGNPFPQTAYIDRSFYRMNEGGTELESASGAIERMEGIFVIANENGETLTFSTEAPAKGGEQLVVNLTQNRGTSIDRVIVGFSEGDVLPKFMLNENNTKLYIPQGNKDYAVVRSAGVGELPLNFRAAKNGSYTLNIDTENMEMNYLHLIDNMTGMDVDLLQNPSYTFEATTRDYESRFKLVFAGASTGSEADESFAFYSNGNWIINNDGKATLQIMDVNGHILCNEQINGSCSKSFEAAPGVYMFRLINGDNVKVQKIVVR